jgi:hypothetical protein
MRGHDKASSNACSELGFNQIENTPELPENAFDQYACPTAMRHAHPEALI